MSLAPLQMTPSRIIFSALLEIWTHALHAYPFITDRAKYHAHVFEIMHYWIKLENNLSSRPFWARLKKNKDLLKDFETIKNVQYLSKRIYNTKKDFKISLKRFKTLNSLQNNGEVWKRLVLLRTGICI